MRKDGEGQETEDAVLPSAKMRDTAANCLTCASSVRKLETQGTPATGVELSTPPAPQPISQAAAVNFRIEQT